MDASLLATLDGWSLLAGIGLFLLGMEQLERAVHAVAGDTFRHLLRRATGHPLLSIALGIVATGILQSSSILGLMVLAFVGAGLLPMRNAIGVILGSNIGSTFTGWIVAVIGFRLDLEAVALPLIGIGAIGVVFFAAETRRNAWGAILLAFGLLLLGMQYMIVAADGFARGFDPATLAGNHPAVFFLVGVVVTVIVRTSAATIMMALSAMSAGVLTLEQAAAIAIGADLGTTSTMAIAALKGVAAKKQVALFHVLFNTVTDLLAFFLLLPHVGTLTGWFGITDPLLALPAFHSTFNLVGALLFYPFVGVIGRFLETRFQGGEESVAIYLPRVPATEKEAAFTALENEVRGLFRRVLAVNLRALKIDVPLPPAEAPGGGIDALFTARSTYGEDYETAKRLEGEVMVFVRALQSQKLSPQESARLANLLISAREAVQAAKGVKDIREELVSFRHSSSAWLAAYASDYNRALQAIYTHFAELLLRRHHEVMVVDLLERIAAEEAVLHEHMKQRIYADDSRRGPLDHEFSTVLNVLHEMHGSTRALLRGTRGLLLNQVV
jgi:phosphate:Na+ symporter